MTSLTVGLDFSCAENLAATLYNSQLYAAGEIETERLQKGYEQARQQIEHDVRKTEEERAAAQKRIAEFSETK